MFVIHLYKLAPPTAYSAGGLILKRVSKGWGCTVTPSSRTTRSEGKGGTFFGLPLYGCGRSLSPRVAGPENTISSTSFTALWGDICWGKNIFI
jgi:hypothetical protein